MVEWRLFPHAEAMSASNLNHCNGLPGQPGMVVATLICLLIRYVLPVGRDRTCQPGIRSCPRVPRCHSSYIVALPSTKPTNLR